MEPKVPNLIERAELRHPIPMVRAMVSPPYRTHQIPRDIKIRGQFARMEDIGPHFVDLSQTPSISTSGLLNRKTEILLQLRAGIVLVIQSGLSQLGATYFPKTMYAPGARVAASTKPLLVHEVPAFHGSGDWGSMLRYRI